MEGMDRLYQSLEALAADETAMDIMSHAGDDSDFAHSVHGHERAKALRAMAEDLRILDALFERRKQPKRRKWYW
jgi:hypothetical protein